MKKILLSSLLLLTVATFAQKDELKTLKKLYGKETLSSSDIEKYKSALSTLQSSITEESDVIYSKFYEGMLPLLEINSLGAKATPADQMRIFNPTALENFSTSITNTLEFEKTSGEQVYTKDINETLSWFKPMLSQIAFELNSSSKLKEASSMFYSLYKMDKKEGTNLENAAILSAQAEDYKTAEQLYEEFSTSDYLNNGIIFYAINKVTEQEEAIPNKETRTKLISLGSHEKARDEKMSLKKPDVFRTLAQIAIQNKANQKASIAYDKALELDPNNNELKIEVAQYYFNLGYEGIKTDQKLVDEINNNLDNKTKFDELMGKRKAIFKNTLPFFEKAYSLNSIDANTKQILKMSYEILEMKEKLATIK
jgi:tetratricopeptide (TPR) repeat protein